MLTELGVTGAADRVVSSIPANVMYGDLLVHDNGRGLVSHGETRNDLTSALRGRLEGWSGRGVGGDHQRRRRWSSGIAIGRATVVVR